MVASSARIASSGVPACPRRNRHALTFLLCLLLASRGGLKAQTPAPISVTGPTQVRLGGAAQYSALINGIASSAVVWSVNGVVGGTSSNGTISTSGMYAPGSIIFAGHSVTIAAATQSQPVSSASLTVKVLNLLPTIASGTITQEQLGATFLVDVLGTGFLSTSQLLVSGSDVATTFLSATELESTITLPTGTTSLVVGVLNPNAAQNAPVTKTVTVPVVLASLTQAARLLDQATFGPTLPAIQQVQQVGMTGYLNQQFAIPASQMPAIPNPPVALCPTATYQCAQSSFWQNALTAPDQLRQRVAFALSEIFVVSTNEVNARSIPSYYNLLVNDAFGNFSQIM